MDTTAAARYLRARIHNTNTTTDRTVTVKIGTRVVDKFTLKPQGTEGCSRDSGPFAVQSGTNFIASQDVGTDCVYAITGES